MDPARDREDPGRARIDRAGPAADAAAAERVLFGLVANRALAPSSKLAAAEWMSQDAHIDGLGTVTGDACYRAMDWLHAVRGDLEKQVFDQVADLLNLEVDLLFFDTTSTYFEVEDADADAVRDWRGEKTSDQDDADPGKAAGIPDARQVQGQPRRPAADRDRHGRHPRRDPRPGLVLAREHQ